MKKQSKKINITFSIASIFLLVVLMMAAVSFAEQQFFSSKKSDVLAAGACPGDFTYIASADFCIQDTTNGSTNWNNAALACVQNDEARLCDVAELVRACEDGAITMSGWEWADDYGRTNMNQKTVVNGCTNVNSNNGNRDYRCCKNGLN